MLIYAKRFSLSSCGYKSSFTLLTCSNQRGRF